MMSKSFLDEYKSKLMSADQAVKLVKSGDYVDYGQFAAMTLDLDAALAKRKDELKNVVVRGCTSMHYPAVIKVDQEQEHFIFSDFSLSGISRKMADNNLAYVIPESYHEIPNHYRKNTHTDVAFVAATPMDKYGYFNLSTSCSTIPASIEMAKHVVIEVNSSLPYCYGDNRVHISDVDYVVESKDNPVLPELPEVPVTDVDKKIAALIMEEIEDGACLQLGIGGMPNTVGKMIAESDLKNLGVHTEMLVDSYVDMYNAGRITNKAKQIDKGEMVYTFAMGTQKLYEFLDHNPSCVIRPVDYTNDPFIVAQNDKVISLCSCLNVDILGQISSESIGFRQISATGGQLDFHFASFRSKGGKGFVCMPSTSLDRKTGKLVSKIVPSFTPGTVVTVPSSLTNYVVTEYGIVNLKGKSTWERAEAIVSIAHPEFRDELINACRDAKVWRKSSKIDSLYNAI